MISIILSISTAIVFYSKSKKVGASKIKWTIIGVIVSIGPLALVPSITVYITQRADLAPLSLMGAIIIVIVTSGVLIRQIKPCSDLGCDSESGRKRRDKPA